MRSYPGTLTLPRIVNSPPSSVTFTSPFFTAGMSTRTTYACGPYMTSTRGAKVGAGSILSGVPVSPLVTTGSLDSPILPPPACRRSCNGPARAARFLPDCADPARERRDAKNPRSRTKSFDWNCGLRIMVGIRLSQRLTQPSYWDFGATILLVLGWSSPAHARWCLEEYREAVSSFPCTA